MRAVADALAAIALTLWVGGLWVVGVVVAPALFAGLDRPLAGALAGRMFTFMAWIGLACGACLLLHRLGKFGSAAVKQGVFRIVAAMVLLVAAGYFGVQPILEDLRAQAVAQNGAREVMDSALRDRFMVWHGVSGVLYVLVSALGLGAVVLAARGR
jgi:hypothetical protein